MNDRVFVTLLCLALVSLGTAGCAHDEMVTGGLSDTVIVTGTVRSFAGEGHCWSITTDGGKVYELRNLPGSFQTEGLPVKARLNVLGDLPSMCMLGRIAEVLQIAKAP